MGKKLDNKIWAVMAENKEQEKQVRSQFYPNGALMEIIPSVNKTFLANLFEKAKQLSASQILTQEKLEELCFQIRENVKAGKEGNLEIRFDQMEQLFDRKKYPLGNTIFKMCLLEESPVVIYIKDGNVMNLRLFIGGENTFAILASKEEDGEISYVLLNEFHMLAFRENQDVQKEIGLMTSYTCQIGKVFSSVIFSFNLDPIKSLLLADWLQAEWERAMEDNKNPMTRR